MLGPVTYVCRFFIGAVTLWHVNMSFSHFSTRQVEVGGDREDHSFLAFWAHLEKVFLAVQDSPCIFCKMVTASSREVYENSATCSLCICCIITYGYNYVTYSHHILIIVFGYPFFSVLVAILRNALRCGFSFAQPYIPFYTFFFGIYEQYVCTGGRTKLQALDFWTIVWPDFISAS